MATTETALVFFGYALICVVVLGFATRLAIKRRDLPGFVCTPIVLLTLVLENLFLGIEFVAGTAEDVATLTSIRFTVHSLVVPLFIIACFELGYQVHKKRGVNYCCIRFEEGHRNQNDTIAQMLRFFPWVLAVAVCVLSLVANAPHINDPTSPKANRFNNEQLNFRGDDLSSVMDFLPPLSLVCIAAYAGGSLWKYGTYYAMEVHATTINPWVFLFLAAIFHLVAGLVTSDEWSGPFLTNGAELVLATAVVHATYRVDMNLEEIRELGDDLHETNQMSKAIQDANKRASGAAPNTAPAAVGASDVDIEVGGGGGGAATRSRGTREPARNGRSARRMTGRNAGMAVIAARRAQRGGPRRGPSGGSARGMSGSGRMQRAVRRGRVIRKTPRAGPGSSVRRMGKRPPSQRKMEHSNNDSDSARQVEMRGGTASDSYSD